MAARHGFELDRRNFLGAGIAAGASLALGGFGYAWGQRVEQKRAQPLRTEQPLHVP